MHRWNRTRIGALCATILAAAAVAGVAATPASAAPSKQRLKSQLTMQLRASGLTVKRVLPCRARRGGRNFRCEWRAVGTYTNGPGYSCKGHAVYSVKAKRRVRSRTRVFRSYVRSAKNSKRVARRLRSLARHWRIDRCLNAELWDMLLARGVQPTAVLKPRVGKRALKYEWRASGMWAGEVPYRCKNVARYVRKGRQWKVGACNNEIAWAEPLAPAPGPHPAFGFNDDFTQPRALDQLGQAVAIGANSARFNVSWESVERNRDSYSWSTYDDVIEEMRAQGVRPVLILGSAPCWAQDNPSNCSQVGSPRDEEIDEYAEFAAQVARRYPQARAIEVWNEPNWTHFWRPLPDPARFARMVREAADAVHATGTGVPVIVGGAAPLANSSGDGRKVAVDEFMRGVYGAGGIGSADAVAYHVYFGAVDDYVLNMRQQIARLRGVMAANGDSGVPIWITEMGISSEETANAKGQGPLLAELYTTLRRIENIPVVLVHRLVEAYDPLSGAIDRRGVIDTHGNRKPAFCSLGHVRGSVAAGC